MKKIKLGRKFLNNIFIAITMLLLFPLSALGEGEAATNNKTVVASEFKLIDKKGTVRGLWGTDSENNPALVLLDKSGNKKLYVGVHQDAPTAILFDKQGKNRLLIGLKEDDTPYVSLRNKNGKIGALLAVLKQAGSAISLYDYDGKRKAAMFVHRFRDPVLSLLDSNEKTSVLLSTTSGKPQLWLKGKTSKSGAVLMVENDDVPNLRMMNSEGETQLVLAARKPGPGLFLRDKGGKTRAGLYHHDGIGSYLQLSRHNGTVATALSASQKSGAHLTFADEQNGGRMAIGHSKKGLSYIHLDDKTHQPKYIMAVTNDGGAISKMIHADGSEIVNIITPDGKPYSAISRRGVNMWSIPDTGASIPENTLPGVPGGGMNWDEILGGAVQ